MVQGLIDAKGKMIIELEGVWRPITRESPKPNRADIMQSLANHYVVSTNASDIEASWEKKFFSTIKNWLGMEKDKSKIVCHCYDKQGTLIWSSAWIRYETKCIMIITGALLVALIARPRRRRSADGQNECRESSST